MTEYVTRSEHGTLRVAGSRVTLASLVHVLWRGETPETIVQAFPSLSLEQVYGATAYYLADQKQVDQEIEGLEGKWRDARAAAEVRNPALRARLLAARAAT
jgi:uncharacterized protein (DUF433 family)